MVSIKNGEKTNFSPLLDGTHGRNYNKTRIEKCKGERQ